MCMYKYADMICPGASRCVPSPQPPYHSQGGLIGIYVYIYIYIYMYIYVYVDMYIYICVHIYIYIYILVRTCAFQCTRK